MDMLMRKRPSRALPTGSLSSGGQEQVQLGLLPLEETGVSAAPRSLWDAEESHMCTCVAQCM